MLVSRRPRLARTVRWCTNTRIGALIPTARERAGSPVGVVSALLIVILSYSIMQGMVIPAIPGIASAYAIDVTTATWVLSGNLAMTAVAVPLLGRLGDIFGRRRVLLVTLLIYAAGSILAAVAPTFPLLVAARVVQGVGGGVFALSYGLAREWVRPESRTRAVGILAVSVGFGGMIGLPLGGLVLDYGPYAWIMWSSLGMALVAIAAVLVVVPRHGLRTPSRLDLRGAALLAVVVALPLFILARLGKSGSADVVFAFLVAIVAIAVTVFVRVEQSTLAPMIDITLARSRQLVVANTVSLLVGFGNFAIMVQVPLLAQAQGAGLGVDAMTSGLLLLPGSLMLLPIGFVVGRLSGALGNRTVLVLGGALSTAGFLSLALWHDTRLSLILGVVVVFSGIGFSFATSVNIVVQSVPAAQTGEATGVNALLRIFGSAIGAPITIGIMSVGAVEGVSHVPVLVGGSVTAAFVFLAFVMAFAGALAMALRPSESDLVGRSH